MNKKNKTNKFYSIHINKWIRQCDKIRRKQNKKAKEKRTIQLNSNFEAQIDWIESKALKLIQHLQFFIFFPCAMILDTMV